MNETPLFHAVVHAGGKSFYQIEDVGDCNEWNTSVPRHRPRHLPGGNRLWWMTSGTLHLTQASVSRVKTKLFHSILLFVSELGRRGVGHCSMSSSMQEGVLYLIEGVGDCKEWNTTVPRRCPRTCCVAIQSSELSAVINGVWNVLDRVGGRREVKTKLFHSILLLVSMLERLLCYDEDVGDWKVYESPQLSETQLFHASTPSPGGPVVMNHVWKRYTSHRRRWVRSWIWYGKRWSGVSETRCGSTDFYTRW